jgi:hypothetical protein
MVQKMGPFQELPILRAGLGVVHIEMQHVIHQVPDDKTCQHGQAERWPEEQAADAKGDEHNRSAEEAGHHKPQRVARVDVMDAMDQEMDAGAELAGKLPVK